MGALLSRDKIASDDYEKILSNLDNDIQKKENQLSEIRIKDRRVGTLWMIYSTVLWIIYIVYYLFALQEKYEDITSMALTVSPIVMGPICIFYVRKGVKWIYFKRLASIEQKLVSLRKNQKLKVEELKKKTAYYSTKSLLERYDPTSPQKKELDEQKKNKMIQEQEQQKKRNTQQQQQQQVMMGTQGQMQPQNQTGQPLVPQGQEIPMIPQKQQWYDKLLDVLVGDVGPETKYALICSQCFAHNGLVLPQEIEVIEYTCPHCHQFNPSRKSHMLHPNGPVLPTMSPTPPQEEPHSDYNKEGSPVVGSTALNDKEDQLRQRKAAADSN